ncbi:hypothetical protein [Nocardia noduli]|uniref:hypothetical protein n=1 Tax=Nocardia noduli TaxID=2815722 RepID=UPI001C21EA3E|nr:hypothetical protein [Nocardia noduli]
MSDDPDEESGIRIRTGDGATLPVLTDPVLTGLLDATAETERPFLEVTRGGERIRADLLPDGMYRIAHRSAVATDEFELYTGDPIFLRDIVFAWIDRDPWWSDRVAWSRIDPVIAELESVRAEVTDLLDGFGALDALTGAMDDALTRADELLAGADDPSRSFDSEDIGAATVPLDAGDGFDTDDPFARIDALLAMDLDDPGPYSPPDLGETDSGAL